MSRAAVWVAAAALALNLATAHAGQACNQDGPKAAAVQRGIQLAERVAKTLTDSGAQVVMIGRVGQNLTEYGQRYSHIGFAYRQGDVWRVAHKLNECGTDQSDLYRQGLADFFMDDPYDYEAGIVTFTPEVQARLLVTLADNAKLAQMHTPRYNMLAYPWSLKYQQSNQWAIELLALSEEPAAVDREHAQAWLRLKGYQPATLRISTMKRLGARATKANIAFDDHPDDKRYDGRIDTVTADSVFQWLARSGLGSRVVAIR